MDDKGIKVLGTRKEVVSIEVREEERRTVEYFEAEVRVFYNDRKIGGDSSFHDMYGRFTGLKEAIKYAHDLIRYYQIDESSRLEIRISLLRYVLEQRNTGLKEYDGTTRWETLNPNTLPNREVVWTSKQPKTFEEITDGR